MTTDDERKGIARSPSRRSLRGLDALNFCLADVRDGLGPYLAIYLIAERGPTQGWNEATVGLVMTIAGIAGLVAQTPVGALVDRTRHKRAIVIAAALCERTRRCNVRKPRIRSEASIGPRIAP